MSVRADLTPEQKTKILEKRRARDPVHHYIPTSTQQKCLDSEKRYRLIEGPNQSGKTNHAVFETAMYARGLHPTRPSKGARWPTAQPVNVLVVAPSRTQLEGIWAHRLLTACQLPGPQGKHPLIPKREIERVYSVAFGGGHVPGKIVLKNGSIIRFMVSGDMSSWERVQGFQYDAIIRDEAVGNANLGAELLPRLGVAQTASERGERPLAGWLLWAATPTLINDEYFEFKRHAQAGGVYDYFFIMPSENPAFSMQQRELMAESLGEREAKIRMWGTASALTDALIYGAQWSDERHILRENYEPTPMDNLWVSLDPGGAGKSSHPTGILFAAISPDSPRQVRCIDYFNTERRTLDDNLKLIADYLQGRDLEGFIVDIAAQKMESRGKSVYTQLLEILQELQVRSYRGVMCGRNRHWDGITRVQRYLDPMPWDPTAPPELVFNPRCKRLLQQMVQYRGKPAAKFTGEGGVVKKDDEGPDCVRYLLSHEPAYAKRSPNRSLPVVIDGEPIVQAPAMSDAERWHKERLAASARLVERMARGKGGPRRMATRALTWA